MYWSFIPIGFESLFQTENMDPRRSESACSYGDSSLSYPVQPLPEKQSASGKYRISEETACIFVFHRIWFNRCTFLSAGRSIRKAEPSWRNNPSPFTHLPKRPKVYEWNTFSQNTLRRPVRPIPSGRWSRRRSFSRCFPVSRSSLIPMATPALFLDTWRSSSSPSPPSACTAETT